MGCTPSSMCKKIDSDEKTIYTLSTDIPNKINTSSVCLATHNSIFNSSPSTLHMHLPKVWSSINNEILHIQPFYPFNELFDQFQVKHLLHSRLRVGAHLEDYYEVDTVPIGNGISGPVHKLTHIKLQCVYAVKTLRRSHMNISATQLCNEVLIYLKLDHPNVAKLCEVFIEDDSIHLVMEYCKGSDLYKQLKFIGRFTEDDSRRITLQMLSAISYCHNQHICHRDLKLENWVFTDSKELTQIKMIDFGLSCMFIPGNPMKSMRGTIDYVSPEMMDGSYLESCDLWSIGIIIYSMISGINPFKGKNDLHTLWKIKNHPLTFPPKFWSNISTNGHQFIAQLLKKDVSERMTLQQALNHPWLMPIDKFFWGDVDVQIFEQIQNFANLSVLKKATLGIIALYYPPIEQIYYLENQFRKLDHTGRGMIEINMLAKAVCEKLNITEEEALIMCKKIDLFDDSNIQLWEFLTATLEFDSFYFKEMLLNLVFERFDKDGKGHINLENLRQVLGNSYGGIVVEEILKVSDLKKNGVIEFDEFLKAFEILEF